MKILVSLNIPEIGINMLREEGLEVKVWNHDQPMTYDQSLTAAKEHDILLSTGANKIDANFLDSNKHLKLISQFAAGYDNIDLKKAKILEIPIANTPNAMVDATADIAFALMLAVSRKMFYMHKQILEDAWGHFRPRANLGIELKGKTLGVFGMGRIGTELARRCVGAYDMKVLYHNRTPNREAEKQMNAIYVSFDDLLAKSDIISVHCPLSADTKKKFNTVAFAKMRPSSIFLNTARGGVHDENDLIEALRNGTIWGAGLDVTDPEPMLHNNPLLRMENVAITPHIGSATMEARNEMSRLAAMNIIQYCKGEPIRNLVR